MRAIKFRAWDGSGKYVAGSDGLIYSTDFNHTGKTRALKGVKDRDGYPHVLMNIDGKRIYRASHKLVALAFLGAKPTSKHQVNHKNGIRSDNRPENLEWVTHQENVIHGFRVNGRKHSAKQRKLASLRFSKGSNPKAKLTMGQVSGIRDMRKRGFLLKEIASNYQISTAQVSAIARNKFWV